MYYGLIIISVIMFGGSFALQDVYRKKRGSNLKISMESACIGALAGLVVLLVVNGFKFEFTPFTLVIALILAVSNICFTFCTFRALEVINLSLFSVFSMLGGMLLPFLQGVIFYDESFTLAKLLCIIFICAALALTFEKNGSGRGYIYYVGIFVLNGMSGVMTKIYNESDYPKASAAGFSICCALTSVVLAGALWILLGLKDRNAKPISEMRNESKAIRAFDASAYGLAAAYGAINKVANFLLVIALVHVESSVQYPMITGGVMIVSTAICFFGDRKPSKKEIYSVVLAFIAMLLLFIVPI